MRNRKAGGALAAFVAAALLVAALALGMARRPCSGSGAKARAGDIGGEP